MITDCVNSIVKKEENTNVYHDLKLDSQLKLPI
jgi:hypothetical protein